jgi:hypothetical protein
MTDPTGNRTDREDFTSAVVEDIIITDADEVVEEIVIVEGAGVDDPAGIPVLLDDSNTYTEGSDDDPEVIPGTTNEDVAAD